MSATEQEKEDSVSRLLRRDRLFLLLSTIAAVFLLTGAASAAPFDADTVGALLEGVVAAFATVLWWNFKTFRAESRESQHKLRDSLHAISLAVARIEERDRISEMLDKRLPPG